jgi:cytochrome c551/c552
MRLIAQILRTAACAAGALALVASTACTGADSDATAASGAGASTAAAATTPGGLTPFQLEHGIGPITTPVTLDGTANGALAASGGKVFEQKCAACHKMGERYVGPALGDVTKRRTPAFVMNMVLNPQGMVEKHPATKKLLGEFFVAMPNQNLSPDEARQVLEYLRTQAP